ncbi:MAG TPA: protoporphyrinogen oxidase [Pseudonocardiaceae bacterium]|nr:protoporphyrinogen oxidase [Pseudonocardiaceae bacterium]
MQATDVLVIGAGIAGLTVAHTLRRAPAAPSVQLIEAGGAAGGKVTTTVVEGYTFDLGPGQFSSRAKDTAALVAELGLTDRLTMAGPAARRVHIVRGDRVLPVPTGPLTALRTPLLSIPGKLRILLEPLLAGHAVSGESVHDFAARHFGREFARVVVAAVAAGTTATDIASTSLDAAFPRVRQLEKSAGRTGLLGAALRAARGAPSGQAPPLATFSPGGVGVLTGALAESLGAAIHCDTHALSLGKGNRRRYAVHTREGLRYEADQIVLAVPSYVAGRLLADLAPGASTALDGIPFVGVRLFGFGYRLSDLPEPLANGGGVLAPFRPGRRAFGIAPLSTVFPAHAPDGHALVRVFAGGQHDPGMLELSTADASDAVRADLSALLGLTAKPAFSTEVIWHRGIPHYRLDHPARLRTAERSLADHPGLHLTGNSYYGAGIDATIRHARGLAGQILRQPRPVPATAG